MVFFLLASSSEGFAAWYDPLLCADLEDWLHLPDCLFFLGVISFTLRLECFLHSFEALTELDELREALGCGFKPLYYEFFQSLLWEVELYQL